VQARVGVVDDDVLGLEGEAPALGHGVARVDREVEHDLLQTHRVDDHGPERGLGDRVDLDPLAEGAPQEQVHAPETFVEVHRPRRHHRAPGEREEVAGQLGRPLRRPEHLLEVVEPLGLHVLAQELSRAEDRRQEVVEIVRDAAREAADAVHLLRLHQLRLEAPLLAHVAVDEPRAHGDAVGVTHHAAAQERRHGAPVVAQELVVPRGQARVGDEGAEGRSHQRLRRGAVERGQGLPDDVGLGPPEPVGHGAVALHDHPGGEVHRAEHPRRGLVALHRVAQALLGELAPPPLRREVLGEHVEADDHRVDLVPGVRDRAARGEVSAGDLGDEIPDALQPSQERLVELSHARYGEDSRVDRCPRAHLRASSAVANTATGKGGAVRRVKNFISMRATGDCATTAIAA
jgi:hypothetical protein